MMTALARESRPLYDAASLAWKKGRVRDVRTGSFFFYCKRNAGWVGGWTDGLVPGGACPWHWHGHSVSFLDHPSISSFPKSLVSNQPPPSGAAR